jgi:hypothetical protein
VRSYRAFSPLPGKFPVRPVVLTGNFPGGMFSVALSVPYGPSDYEAHCPAEFGLSSAKAAIARLPATIPFTILSHLRISAILQAAESGIREAYRWKDGESAALLRARNIGAVRRISLQIL